MHESMKTRIRHATRNFEGQGSHPQKKGTPKFVIHYITWNNISYLGTGEVLFIACLVLNRMRVQNGR